MCRTLTILPDENTNAVVFGSRMRIITAEKRYTTRGSNKATATATATATNDKNRLCILCHCSD
jgi:hypothetical protein